MKKRKICVILVDRANYGRMWPVMKAIKEHDGLELQTVCTGTMLLERFGQAVDIVERDGFEVNGRIYMELEGSVPATMAKSIGFATIEFASELQRLKPDILLLIGDRYEALAAAISAAVGCPGSSPSGRLQMMATNPSAAIAAISSANICAATA